MADQDCKSGSGAQPSPGPAPLEGHAATEAFLDALDDAAMLMDNRGHILALNNVAAERFAGGDKQALIGRFAPDLFPPDLAAERRSRGEQLLANRRPVYFEDFRAGMHFGVRMAPILDRCGKVCMIAVFARDITRYKKVESELRVSERKFRSLADQSPNLIFISSGERIIYANRRCEEVLGYSRDQICSESFDFRKVVSPDCCEQLERNMEAHGRGEEVPALECSILDRDSRKIDVIIATKLIDFGKDKAVLGTVTDISLQKRVECEMLRYQERLRALAASLSAAEERARRQLAEEIHDHFGQTLALAKLGLQRALRSPDAGNRNTLIDSVVRMIDRMLHQSRQLTFMTSPAHVRELGLQEAATWLADHLSTEHKLEVTMDHTAFKSRLDADLSIFLFRSLQELLINSVKHSKARHVRVKLSGSDRQVRIAVEDDGDGFDPAVLSPDGSPDSGFGLFSINERLRHMGGSLRIDSSPGNGSRINLSAPLRAGMAGLERADS